MFERFTDEVRRAVVLAADVARERYDDTIRPMHLLIGLAIADEPSLTAAGLTRERLGTLWDGVGRTTAASDLDADALAGIGIDVDAVRAATDRSFGPGALDEAARSRRAARVGHIPFSRASKRAMEAALRNAVAGGSKDIRSVHLLQGVLDLGDPDVDVVLRAAGVSAGELRSSALAAASGSAASTIAGIDRLDLAVADLDASRDYYDAVLAPLGITRLGHDDDGVGYGSDRPFFWIGSRDASELDDPHGGVVRIAFTARDRATVTAFRDAAGAVGAEVVSEPGVHPRRRRSSFQAVVRDPDGNEVEAICHLAAAR